MHQLDIPYEIAELRRLGGEFGALHTQVRDLDCTPGTEALRKVTALLLASQALTGTVLERLAALDASQYAALAGSRQALQTLASSASAAALAVNAYDGTGFPGPPVDEDAVPAARHAEAVPALAECFANATDQLGLAATCCLYTASAIQRATTTTGIPPAAGTRQKPPARLTDAQYTALLALSQGGARRYSGLRRAGNIRISVPGGTRVSIATFDILRKHSLVTWDSGATLYTGQDITVTAEGRRALAHHHPGKAPSAPAAPSTAPSVRR